MKRKEFNQKTLAISKYHSRLYHVLNNRGWSNPLNQIDNIGKEGEKAYRRFKPDHVSIPLSISSAVKLFSVKYVFEGLTSNLNVNDMLHIRHECYIGQAIANEYRKEIEEEFTQEEIQWYLDNIDYAALMAELD